MLYNTVQNNIGVVISSAVPGSGVPYALHYIGASLLGVETFPVLMFLFCS